MVVQRYHYLFQGKRLRHCRSCAQGDDGLRASEFGTLLVLSKGFANWSGCRLMEILSKHGGRYVFFFCAFQFPMLYKVGCADWFFYF